MKIYETIKANTENTTETHLEQSVVNKIPPSFIFVYISEHKDGLYSGCIGEYILSHGRITRKHTNDPVRNWPRYHRLVIITLSVTQMFNSREIIQRNISYNSPDAMGSIYSSLALVLTFQFLQSYARKLYLLHQLRLQPDLEIIFAFLAD